MYLSFITSLNHSFLHRNDYSRHSTLSTYQCNSHTHLTHALREGLIRNRTVLLCCAFTLSCSNSSADPAAAIRGPCSIWGKGWTITHHLCSGSSITNIKDNLNCFISFGCWIKELEPYIASTMLMSDKGVAIIILHLLFELVLKYEVVRWSLL